MSFKIIPEVTDNILKIQYYQLQCDIDINNNSFSWYKANYHACYNNDKLYIVHKNYICTIRNNYIQFKCQNKTFTFITGNFYIEHCYNYTIVHGNKSYTIYDKKDKIITYDYQCYKDVYSMCLFSLYDEIIYDTFTTQFTYVFVNRNTLLITIKPNDITYEYFDINYKYIIQYTGQYNYTINNKKNSEIVTMLTTSDNILVSLQSYNKTPKTLTFDRHLYNHSISDRLLFLSCNVPNNFDHYYNLDTI